MTAGSYCYIGPQGIVHGTAVSGILRITHRPYNFQSWKMSDMNFERMGRGQFKDTAIAVTSLPIEPATLQ
jgi:urocanate hydratase